MTVVDTETVWTEEAGVNPNLSDSFTDRLGYAFFTLLVGIFTAYSGCNNVGTLDPWGVLSVYWHTSTWKAAATLLYTITLCWGVLTTTLLLLHASSGVDIVLNALAILFLVDLDEQLLAPLLPVGTRAAITREFREARDARRALGAWKMWKPGAAVHNPWWWWLLLWRRGEI